MRALKTAIILFIALSFLTGILYTAAVTVLAQVMFPQQANGSLIYSADGAPTGSALIGQSFSDPKYFWPRPSATTDFQYNALASGGSNLGPTNKDLISQVAERVKSFRESGDQGRLPADLVTASGSGLDPHISPAAAAYQVMRVAKARGLDEAKVRALIAQHTKGRQFRILGEPVVNVLELNLALNELRQE
ncbi:MAG: potassium-transporting ATPase subunit KdpC [Dissulfurispiraceae bacterium]|jgi:K+-transporting ATPase ATPase C chain